MGVVSLKCPNCGGSIQLDDTREFGFCQYCGHKMMITKEKPTDYLSLMVERRLKLISDLLERREYSLAKAELDSFAEFDPTNPQYRQLRENYLSCMESEKVHRVFNPLSRNELTRAFDELEKIRKVDPADPVYLAGKVIYIYRWYLLDKSLYRNIHELENAFENYSNTCREHGTLGSLLEAYSCPPYDLAEETSSNREIRRYEMGFPVINKVNTVSFRRIDDTVSALRELMSDPCRYTAGTIYVAMKTVIDIGCTGTEDEIRTYEKWKDCNPDANQVIESFVDGYWGIFDAVRTLCKVQNTGSELPDNVVERYHEYRNAHFDPDDYRIGRFNRRDPNGRTLYDNETRESVEQLRKYVVESAKAMDSIRNMYHNEAVAKLNALGVKIKTV